MPINVSEVKWDEAPAQPVRGGIDPAEAKWDGPASNRIPQWNTVEKNLPSGMKEYVPRIKNSLSIAASLDIPPSQAFDNHEDYRTWGHRWGRIESSSRICF